jgi:hypothetical protein
MMLETAIPVAIHPGRNIQQLKAKKYGALTRKKSGIAVRTSPSQYM